MRAGNPLEQVAAAIYSAILRDLPEIEYKDRLWRDTEKDKEEKLKKRRPYTDEVEVVMFPQMWGSTALGFGGIGGAAMTSAYTTIVFGPNRTSVCVYFGTRLAYAIDDNIPAEFFEDMKNQRMPSVADAIKKYNKNEKQ
jgi:hypothetical protein